MRWQKILSIIKEVKETSSTSHKSCLAIVFDYLRLRKQKQLLWKEYYDYEFETQSDDFRKSFLGGIEQGVYLELLNPFKYYILARNKYLAHLVMENAGIPTPELYCYYSPESGEYTDRRISCDLLTTIRILRDKNITNCVIKQTEGSHGDSVFAVRNISYSDSDATLETMSGKLLQLSSILQQYPLLFEQRIIQTEQFSKFNPTSVNTIRFMTSLMPSGEAKIIATFIKIGRNGAFIDNAGDGGNIDAGINHKNGTLYGAILYNGFRKTNSIDTHPDTGAKLNGTIVNNWDIICKQIISFQKKIPFLKVIGWDVAITTNGPVIIEFNDFWDRTGQLFIRYGWRTSIRDCYFNWKEYNDYKSVYYKMGRVNPSNNTIKKKFERLVDDRIVKNTKNTIFHKCHL